MTRITPTKKITLLKYKADNSLTITQLAKELGILEVSLIKILNNDQPQKITNRTFVKIEKLLYGNKRA